MQSLSGHGGVQARFIDVGLLGPAAFHATYAGVAAAGAGLPAVIWGRAAAHVALGACQSPAIELAPDLEVEAVVRAVGGGAVWVDESQYCFVLVAPLGLAPPRPAEWPAWGLAPAIATFRHFGLEVVRRGADLWLDGRKIAGSGCATIGAAAVLASSFLMQFPHERFVRAIAAPSAGFRDWLRAALRQAMTDWASHAPQPGEDELRVAFCGAVERTLGWRLREASLSTGERAARDEAAAEALEPDTRPGARRVPHGIRLNDAMLLTERERGGATVRELTVDGKVVRRNARRA